LLFFEFFLMVCVLLEFGSWCFFGLGGEVSLEISISGDF
jgi:hypothetical protein